MVRAGAAIAALGSLLSLILGVSRTTLAMARDEHLPHRLASIHPRFAAPHRDLGAVRSSGRGCCRSHRRPCSDRVLIIRRAGVLRDRQRFRVDPRSARDPGVGIGGMSAAGGLAPGEFSARRGRCDRPRRGDLRRATVPVGRYRGGQGREDVVVPDFVEEPRSVECLAQMPGDPRHREDDAATVEILA